jgi:hypothetical protein
MAPRLDGGFADLQKMNSTAPASGYTAHLVDPICSDAYFVAFAPQFNLAFSYIWKSADFPWLGIWEENCSRSISPWDSRTVTRGMEFGVSPFPETRREMISRNELLGAPTYKWLPAKGKLQVEYWIVSQVADSIPKSITWPEL